MLRQHQSPVIETIHSTSRSADQDVGHECVGTEDTPSPRTSFSNCGHRIFVIHGFPGPKYRYYRETLEHWVVENAREIETPTTVHALRFDAPAIPSRGKDILVAAVWELRRFLLGLLRATVDQGLGYDENRDFGHEDDSTSPQHDNSITGASPAPRNSRITFVAHGLGSWVVKDVLAHPSMDSIAFVFARTDLRFLDVGVDKGAPDGYHKYLERNWLTFGFGSPKQQEGTALDRLVSYLREIDGNFATFADMHSDAAYLNATKGDPRPSNIYKDSHHRIWMSQNPVSNHSEVWPTSMVAPLSP